jgi:hypothetical protein
VIEDAETPPVIARQLRRSEISKAEPLSMESTPMADADPRLNGA